MLDFGTNIEIRENELLSKHSSFRIGGEAKISVFPKNKEELVSILRCVKKSNYKYMVIGNGSNMLFDDQGYDGVIIFTKYLTETKYIHKDGVTLVSADCGKSLTELASETGKKHSLTGLEFAYGIPGTVGGAVYMNAGAYGGQMSDVVVSTEYYDITNDEIKVLTREEHLFDYRHSFFADKNDCVILSSTLEMKDGNFDEIYELMNKNMAARREKQPFEYPSAGSTFKRPGGGLFAAKLIDDAGLKGYRVGGAQISEKHAGFTVNIGKATSKDVLAVIEHSKKVVFEKFGVELECEVIYVQR